MKIITYCIVFAFFSLDNAALAQKPPIDTFAINHWAHINGAKLNPDGNYIYYSCIDENGKEENSVESIDHTWKKKLSNVHFSRDGKSFFYQTGDSLFIGQLGKDNSKFISRVSSFELFAGKNGEWLGYRTIAEPNGFSILSLASKK